MLLPKKVQFWFRLFDCFQSKWNWKRVGYRMCTSATAQNEHQRSLVLPLASHPPVADAPPGLVQAIHTQRAAGEGRN